MRSGRKVCKNEEMVLDADDNPDSRQNLIITVWRIYLVP